MKTILKEIALYLLIATVLFNVTVNVIQEKYIIELEQNLFETTTLLNESLKGVNDTLDGILELLGGHQSLILEHTGLISEQSINLAILNRITKPQAEPDFERLLTATVEINTMGGSGAGICTSVDTDYYYILTAQHVVKNRFGNVVSVRTRDTYIYAGEIVKEDPDVDLALVRIRKDGTNIEIVKLATQEPKVKDRVFAVGHPLGATWTITEGVVSNINVYSYLMTTAPATFGNSGGALFNTDGNIIGICSAGHAYPGNIPESNMGLFIKLDTIKSFLGLNNGGELK